MKQLPTIISPLVLALFACGGDRGGAPVRDKGQAADAAYGLVSAKQGLEGRSGAGLSPAQVDGVNVSSEITVSGREGTARITSDTEVGAGGVRVRHQVVFEGYSPDGINFYDGDLTYLTEVVSGAAGASVVEEVSGTAQISGEYNATLELDVRMEIVAGASGVSIRITGTISADGLAFDYDGDVVNLGDDGTIETPDAPDEPGEPGEPTGCEGTYTGTYEGAASGNVQGTLDETRFRVHFISDRGEGLPYVFEHRDGRIRGTSFDITVDASVDPNTCAISGTWVNGVATGTWTAARQ